MSDFLFDIPEQKSPRLLWLEKHGITVHDYRTDDVHRFMATGFLEGSGFGPTSEDAVIEYAKTARIPLWNEEGGQP
jgi:hypothetical protein